MEDNRYMARYEWLDIVKGLGIIYVVIGHFCSNDWIHNWIYSFHMPLFFFASGYLYRKKPISETLKHKFMTLMVPYFIFGTISIMFFTAKEFAFGNPTDLTASFGGLLYGTYNTIVYNKVLWFLPALFCIINLYNIFTNLGGEGQNLARILVIIQTMVYIVIGLPHILPWGLDGRVFHFIIYYMLGNIMSEKGWIKNAGKEPTGCWYIVAVVLVGLNMVLSNRGFEGKVMEYVISLIGIAGWLLISILIEGYGKILGKLGQASLCILCLHVPVCEILTKILVRLTRMTFDSCEKEPLYIFVRCFLTISACMIGYSVIMKTAPVALGKKKIAGHNQD